MGGCEDSKTKWTSIAEPREAENFNISPILGSEMKGELNLRSVENILSMVLSPEAVPSMEWVNETLVREFVFLGFSSLAGLQRLLFVVFLLVYLFTLGTNAVIIFTIVLDRALHTPMYFFLAVLSCSETCYTFVIVPKMLVDLLAQKKTISFLGCAIQMFTFLFLGCSHSFLLAAMGYDRYVAICNPLRYTVLMGHGVCVGLVAAACFCGFTVAQIITSMVFHLPFHSSNQLHHFFCDISPVLKVASHHTHFCQIVIITLCALVLVIPLLLILVSYVHIISAILQFPSTLGSLSTAKLRMLTSPNPRKYGIKSLSSPKLQNAQFTTNKGEVVTI
ncbi:Olfactory receptor 10K2 [Camelus dromedarius]|uniref:Olfactory receptor 10K2 n=1 Tax=Camelus dromedarius TaxID=9838 RepID=A0A5N4CNG9_CAMDR|nr:Olfactory receptor 10K2 [Camelus dromedarius]